MHVASNFKHNEFLYIIKPFNFIMFAFLTENQLLGKFKLKASERPIIRQVQTEDYWKTNHEASSNWRLLKDQLLGKFKLKACERPIIRQIQTEGFCFQAVLKSHLMITLLTIGSETWIIDCIVWLTFALWSRSMIWMFGTLKISFDQGLIDSEHGTCLSC